MTTKCSGEKPDRILDLKNTKAIKIYYWGNWGNLNMWYIR